MFKPYIIEISFERANWSNQFGNSSRSG